MTRPTPRKSSLAGLSPTRPPEQSEPHPAPAAPVAAEPIAHDASPAAADTETASRPQRAATTHRTQRGATTPSPTGARSRPAPEAAGKPRKTGFYQDPADAARMRAAYLHTHAREGVRSLGELINTAVMREVERLERDYNNGEPFEGGAVGTVPTGRPPRP